jgi:hypothetical protein
MTKYGIVFRCPEPVKKIITRDLDIHRNDYMSIPVIDNCNKTDIEVIVEYPYAILLTLKYGNYFLKNFTL